MILLLDVGNTRIKWAQLLDSSLTPQQAVLHKDVPQDTWTKQLFRERFRPARLLVASVAGTEMTSIIRREAGKAWGITPEFATTTGIAGGVTNAYPDAPALGVDRWLAVIAGREFANGAACAIDAGTAVTIDVVSADGLHLGGVIIPGVQMMVDALLDRTSDIADHSRRSRRSTASDAQPGKIFADNTAQAIRNGALLAVASAADRAVFEAAAALKSPPRVLLTGGDAEPDSRGRVLLTGGDAERLQRMMQSRVQVVPDLVLRGLAVIARKPA